VTVGTERVEAEHEAGPFRASGESYREAKPDPLEEMRRDRARRQRRLGTVLGLPLGLATFAGCLAASGTIVADLYDGVPLGSRTPIILILAVAGALACLYAGHRVMSRGMLVVLTLGTIVASGAWVRSGVIEARDRRLTGAVEACRARGDTTTECIERERRCITQLDTSFGEPSFTIYLGDPCAALDAD
jgi:hypothetical protein